MPFRQPKEGFLSENRECRHAQNWPKIAVFGLFPIYRLIIKKGYAIG